MAQPFESMYSPQTTYRQLIREPNPVITPYKRSEARELYDESGLMIDTRNVELEDGLIYPVTSSHLRRAPDGLQGLSHFEGVAWTLRPDEKNSIYQQRLVTLGRLGIEGTVVGIPQNFGKWIKYDDNVDNMLGIFVNEADELHRDSRVVKLSGMSQAAMNGTGFIVRGEEQHDVQTIDAHLNVLCLPDGVKLNTVRNIGHAAAQLWETLRNMPYELQAAGDFLRLDRESQKQILATIDISASALYTQPQMLRSLFSGKTGDYAKQLPDDVLVLAELNDKDALSRPRRWLNILGQKANVAIKYSIDDAHADCIAEIKQTDFAEYQTATADILRSYPQLRSHPETIGRKFLQLMRTHYPEFSTSSIPDSIPK